MMPVLGRSASLEAFTAMVHELLQSGYVFNEAIALLSRPGVSPKVRRIAAQLERGIRKGMPLSAALRDAKDRGGRCPFPQDFIQWFALVEQTGNLAGAFGSQAKRLRQARENRGLLKAALVYPLFIVVLSLGGTAALIAKVVPFLRANRLLDSGTGNSLLSGIILAVLTLSVLAAAFIFAAYRFTGRPSGETLLFSCLADCARAGLPISRALPSCAALRLDARLSAALFSIKRAVSSGTPLDSAFRDTGRFPPYVTDLMLLSGATGDLASVFAQAEKFYGDRDKTRRDVFMRACEPAAISIVGIYLAIILESAVVPLLTGLGGFF